MIHGRGWFEDDPEIAVGTGYEGRPEHGEGLFTGAERVATNLSDSEAIGRYSGLPPCGDALDQSFGSGAG